MNEWNLYEDFSNFISNVKIRNFKSYELLIHSTRPKNTPPPKELWHNIVPTIIVLDKLRDFFDKPILISSAYRSTEYNTELSGSASKSQHIAFNALDFSIRGVVPLEAATVLKTWRQENKKFESPIQITRKDIKVNNSKIPSKKLNVIQKDNSYIFEFNGGVKNYSTFIHLDTRGINASW